MINKHFTAMWLLLFSIITASVANDSNNQGRANSVTQSGISQDDLDYEQFKTFCLDVIGNLVDRAREQFSNEIAVLYDTTEALYTKNGKEILFLKKVGPYIEQQRDVVLEGLSETNRIVFSKSEKKFAEHVDQSIEPLKQSFNKDIAGLHSVVNDLTQMAERLCSIHLGRKSADATHFVDVDFHQILPPNYSKYLAWNSEDSSPKKERGKGRFLQGEKCKADSSLQYDIYFPSSYHAEREEKWPILFICSPKRGYAELLKNVTVAAEKNNWIFAACCPTDMSDWKENFPIGKEWAISMVEDVLENVPIDEKRCYTLGAHQGGVHISFWLDEELPGGIQGAIASECHPFGATVDVPVIAFCTADGAWRHSMARNFSDKDDAQLYFYPSGSTPDEDFIFNAITWHNAHYLRRRGTPEEIDAFSEMLFEEITAQSQSNPYFAYKNARVLASVKKARHASKAKGLADELKRNSDVQTYIEGEEAVHEFVDDYLPARSFQEYTSIKWEEGRPGDAANKLAEQYEGTFFHELFRDFGKSCYFQKQYLKKNN